jgi:hypothetical protein
MPTDRSLRALREANPRSQAGFGEWIERFDPLREQIPAAAVAAGLLQEGAVDLRAPAGVTRQVARRRLMLRSVAGVAVALTAGAVALAVVVVPGARHGGTGGSVVDAAYVVNRVDSALSAAEPGEIAQMTVTSRGAVVRGGSTSAEEWSFGGQWRSVIYSPAGHLAYEEGVSTSSVYTLVSYPARTWSRGPGPSRPPGPLSGAGGCGSALPASVASALRAAVFCVHLRVAGRQRVDGVEAIELTGRDSRISETIWVSPGTYLPLRVVTRPASGSPGPWQEADITWLRPTGQNLARLTVTIPAGFRQVPLTQPVGPVPKYPGGPLPKSR